MQCPLPSSSSLSPGLIPDLLSLSLSLSLSLVVRFVFASLGTLHPRVQLPSATLVRADVSEALPASPTRELHDDFSMTLSLSCSHL